MTYVDQTGCSYSSSFTNEQTDWSSNLPPHEVVFVLVKILAIMSSPSRTGPFKYTINEVKYRLSSVVVDKIFVETGWDSGPPKREAFAQHGIIMQVYVAKSGRDCPKRETSLWYVEEALLNKK